jgi:hypothetical protein
VFLWSSYAEEAFPSNEDWKLVIRSWIIVTEKYSPISDLIKIKARFVAGGNKQDRKYGKSRNLPSTRVPSL